MRCVIIYNSFIKLKTFLTFENLGSSSESQLWNGPASLTSCFLLWPESPSTVGYHHEQSEDCTGYSSHKVVVRRWDSHLQPYGVLKFGGTNQNVNLRSYLGNKTCVTRNRPRPKYTLVCVHSGASQMSLSKTRGVSRESMACFSRECVHHSGKLLDFS